MSALPTRKPPELLVGDLRPRDPESALEFDPVHRHLVRGLGLIPPREIQGRAEPPEGAAAREIGRAHPEDARPDLDELDTFDGLGSSGRFAAGSEAVLEDEAWRRPGERGPEDGHDPG